MKICIVSSCGGHLSEVRVLREVYGRFDHFYVLNARIELPPDMERRTIFIRHSQRDWFLLANFWEAWRILSRERPDVILSTGAGPAVPFALVGKLCGSRIVFIETSARVTAPSLTGRILYRLADRFFYQWPGLARYFPSATYGGLLL